MSSARRPKIFGRFFSRKKGQVMAYASGTATTVNNLLDALRVFLLANGWTVNLYGDDGLGSGKRLHVQKGSELFFNFRSCSGENPYNGTTITDLEIAQNLFALWFNPSTGYDAAERWYRQPGATYTFTNPPTNTLRQYRYLGITALNASVNYWLFSFNDCVYMVVENPTGRFNWLGFGGVSKINDWSGGALCFAKHIPGAVDGSTKTVGFIGSSYGGQGASRGFLRLVGVDGLSGWATTEAINAAGAGSLIVPRVGDSFQKMQSLWLPAPNLFNSQSVLMPIEIICSRDGANFTTSTPFSSFGILDGLYFVNIRALAPAGLFSVSTDDFRVFSFHEKADEVPFSPPNNSAGNLGFALKTN
jgi:hypothetical protein